MRYMNKSFFSVVLVIISVFTIIGCEDIDSRDEVEEVESEYLEEYDYDFEPANPEKIVQDEDGNDKMVKNELILILAEDEEPGSRATWENIVYVLAENDAEVYGKDEDKGKIHIGVDTDSPKELFLKIEELITYDEIEDAKPNFVED